MVTIVDVARAAGVSRGTASNVFNHPDRVRQNLRDKVIAAAAELGYGGPEPKARFLRSGKVRAIGVTPPGAYGVRAAFDNPYLRTLLSGVGEVCDQRGASLTVVTGVGDDKTWGIRNAVVDGFVLHRFEEAAVLEARRRRLPCVLVDMEGDAEISSVRVDDRFGARAAAAHLVALGHRRFAVFSVLRDTSLRPTAAVFHGPGSRRDLTAGRFALDEGRLGGYLDALARVGIEPEDVPIIETWADFIESTTAGAAMLFDRLPGVTGVLAMTDIQALGVIAEARRRGIRVPEDLSVVGFDDIAEAAMSSPPLTTIAHPMVEKGRIAARLLFDEVAGEHVVLPVKLVIRGSTAKPPKAPSNAYVARKRRSRAAVNRRA